MEDRNPAPALSGSARGIIVGSMFAFGWAFYGSSLFDRGGHYAVLAAALVVTGTLLFAAITILRRVRSAPPPKSHEISAGRRAWRWFWVNLVAEIVLLNIAVNLLAAPDLRVYWIAAISAVVGLHFLPMAVFFRARSYWFVGFAMMLGAVVAAVLIARHPERAADLARIEALANAVFLWVSLGVGAASGRARVFGGADDLR